jgi:predicted ester cyclase
MIPTAIETNKQLVARFDQILNTGEVALLDELCTQDMVNHALAPGRPAGLAGTREFLSTDGQRMRTDRWERLDVIAEGDFVVQHGMRGGHWPGGVFLGIPAKEGDYSREVAFIYRIRDGRICERWAVRDDLTMLRQLGGV